MTRILRSTSRHLVRGAAAIVVALATPTAGPAHAGEDSMGSGCTMIVDGHRSGGWAGDCRAGVAHGWGAGSVPGFGVYAGRAARGLATSGVTLLTAGGSHVTTPRIAAPPGMDEGVVRTRAAYRDAFRGAGRAEAEHRSMARGPSARYYHDMPARLLAGAPDWMR